MTPSALLWSHSIHVIRQKCKLVEVVRSKARPCAQTHFALPASNPGLLAVLSPRSFRLLRHGGSAPRALGPCAFVLFHPLDRERRMLAERLDGQPHGTQRSELARSPSPASRVGCAMFSRELVRQAQAELLVSADTHLFEPW